jgi:D-beta-D-heptose 7-phosphate kinase/D-beta-D-heptose 1-phosphate adenosyltransferase
MQAKKNCDVLFVGMNSDASVKRNKGENRPIQDEKTRAFLLASLEMVDYVIVFDDETALPLVDAIRPNIIAKEGYKIENWPEAQRVIEYGGRAIELERIDGYSTSKLFQKIRD